MIYKQCSAHGCTKIVAEGIKYCPQCTNRHNDKEKERYREYSRRRRQDNERKKYQDFYSSDEWINLSEARKIHFFGMCVICWLRDRVVNSIYTHHIEETDKRPDLMLDEDNLIPLCPKCHTKVHKMYNSSDKDEREMKKILVETIIKFDKEYY
ncbi:MAG: HNH endonuclease [Bacillota bacterium]|nr:HNH endonuclease [Bacillota bacterium]